MSFHVLNHPLVHENLAIIRDKKTTPGNFRRAVDTLSSLMVYPLTENLPEKHATVETPLTEAKVSLIACPIVLVPILRAGLGMLSGMQQMMPEASVGVLGMARNEETLLPDFSCHTLRHTFTTRLIESGMNVKVIQEALGHSDIQTTLNIYADVTKELKKQQFAHFDDFIAEND